MDERNMSSLQDSPKNVSDDIVILLHPRDKVKSVMGLVDPRLFTGENKLHAKLVNGLWSLYYENGVVPASLKQQWTSWDKMYNFIHSYFDKRNITINAS